MQDDFKLSIDGLKEVQQFLNQLPNDINEAIVKDLNRKAGTIVAKQLKQDTPDGNSTKKSKFKLSNKVKLVASKTKTGVFIGFSKKGFASYLINSGTKQRSTKGKGKITKPSNRGSISAKPFVEKSYEKSGPKAVEFLQTNYLKIINSSIKKYLKKVKQ